MIKPVAITEKICLAMLKKNAKREIGRKCKDFHYGCITCQVYMALDILEDFLKQQEVTK